MGYYRAGFDVVGLDLCPQPHYPFRFIRGDMLKPPVDLSQFDAIHASPPCQGYSRLRHLPWLKDRTWPMLIGPVREILEATGRPWVIENVADSPLEGITLCGTMFDLTCYRHRRFESNVLLLAPPHPKHKVIIRHGRGVNARPTAEASGWITVAGHHWGANIAREAMGIEWMTGAEIAQAIPPAYTEFVGRQLVSALSPGRSNAQANAARSQTEERV
jgi:DNA (cytosine-5)-methyltransferase 1